MDKFLKKLEYFSELVVFKHSIFALPFIFMAMMLSSKEMTSSAWFGFKLLFLGLFCAVSARNFAMAFNRYLDANFDKNNPRTSNRVSVDGRLDEKNIIIFILINAIIFIFSSYFINSLAFYLSFPILLILGIYSYIKRFSALAHLVLGICLGLSPIAGVIAVTGSVNLWSILLALGVVFWVCGFDILYSLQDMEFDRENGLFSIPSIYGYEASLFMSAFFHFLCILFWLLFAFASELGFWMYSGIFLSAIILTAEHIIIRKNFLEINKAFFTLNAYLGIVFFIFFWIAL